MASPFSDASVANMMTLELLNDVDALDRQLVAA
jgi:hypothetical protein